MGQSNGGGKREGGIEKEEKNAIKRGVDRQKAESRTLLQELGDTRGKIQSFSDTIVNIQTAQEPYTVDNLSLQCGDEAPYVRNRLIIFSRLILNHLINSFWEIEIHFYSDDRTHLKGIRAGYVMTSCQHHNK